MLLPFYDCCGVCVFIPLRILHSLRNFSSTVSCLAFCVCVCDRCTSNKNKKKRSCRHTFLHTTARLSSCYYMCVLIICLSAYYQMCLHTTPVLILPDMCPRSTEARLSSFYYICVLILIHTCFRTSAYSYCKARVMFCVSSSSRYYCTTRYVSSYYCIYVPSYYYVYACIFVVQGEGDVLQGKGETCAHLPPPPPRQHQQHQQQVCTTYVPAYAYT